MAKSVQERSKTRLYDDDGDLLLEADKRTDRVVLLPSGDPRLAMTDRDRIRIQWGQHLLADLVAGRYRTAICAVNDVDNEHGIVGDLMKLVPILIRYSSRSSGPSNASRNTSSA